MKKGFLLLVLSVGISYLGLGQGTISVGTPYSQNFDGIGNTATATLPTGWKIENIATVRSVTTAYASVANTATQYALTYNAAMSSTASNGRWNFGGTSDLDRAVGGISSSSASKSVNMYLQLTNNGLSDIGNFTISYDAERFRNGSNAAGFSIRFYYSTTGAASSWTEVTSCVATFTANADNNGSTTNPMETISVSNKTLSQALTAGSSIYLAWSYSVTSGTTTSNAQALGIDNITITANAATNTAPTVTTQAVSSIGSTTATGNGNITATGGENPHTRGVCWVLYSNPTDPTISDFKAQETGGSFGTGAYTESMTADLSAETRYKLKAYAINTPGTGYGSLVDFWTLSAVPASHTTAFTNSVISQTQINLSFDAASTITNADGYIILQKTGSAPTGSPLNGTAYTTGNIIGDGTVAAVVTNSASTSASITGLTAGTHYYFTIMPYNYNGANNETYHYKTDGTVPGTDATTSAALNATSEVSGPAIGSQPNPVLISSLVNTEGAAVKVFDMDLYDYGPDGQPTKITQLTIKAGTNNTADWSTVIQGVRLSKDNGLTYVTIGAPSITASQIVIPITSGNLNVPDANAITVAMYIYLKNSGLTDNQILEFKVDAAASAHGFIADPTGSTFLATFPGAPTSNQVLIDVVATKYKFSTQPSNTAVNSNFSAAVEAVDANNNRDLDQTSSVTLAASAGTLSTVTGNPHALVSGNFSWTDLQNNTAGTGVSLSASGTLTGTTSSTFTIFSAQPTTQASTLVFTNVGVTTMTLSWINGNGEKRLVAGKAAGAPGSPVNGTAYTADAAFGNGGTIAANEYVVYNGTGSTVDITNLTGSTSYTFKVYEYNGGSGTENYNTTSNAATQITSGLTYYSTGSGDPAVLTNWKTGRDGSGTSPSNFTSGSTFVIENGDNMTTTAAWGISGNNSKLKIENGGTLTANHTVTLNAATTFQIETGGNYFQNIAMTMGSSIFAGTEVFASGSNITITIMPTGTSAPSLPGWGNLTINQTTGGTALGWGGNLSNIQGNLTILGTGSGTTRHAFTASSDVTTTIGGNFIITGGNFMLSSGTGKATVNLAGNLTVNGGTLNLANGAGEGVINVVGNVEISSGSLTEGGTTTNSRIVFNKTGTQSFTGGGSIITNNVNFEVASTSTTNLGNSIISGAGNFTLNSGGTLGIGSADGITSTGLTGNIQVSGTRTFNSGANYLYNGTGAQFTGNGLPATINNLTLGGTSELTLSDNGTVTGMLTIGNGTKLNIPLTLTLTVNGEAYLSGSK